MDFGAGGAAVLADLPAGSPVMHLAIGGGKDSTLYVLNRDAMGGLGDANAWQKISLGPLNSFKGAIFATTALWNNYLYVAGVNTPLSAYQLSASTAKFSFLASTTSPSAGFAFPGATPAVSSAGNSNGIVWALIRAGTARPVRALAAPPSSMRMMRRKSPTSYGTVRRRPTAQMPRAMPSSSPCRLSPMARSTSARAGTTLGVAPTRRHPESLMSTG